MRDAISNTVILTVAAIIGVSLVVSSLIDWATWLTARRRSDSEFDREVAGRKSAEGRVKVKERELAELHAMNEDLRKVNDQLARNNEDLGRRLEVADAELREIAPVRGEAYRA